MARLFFAVAVSPEIASIVEARKAALRRVLPGDTVRFTDPAQSHLTLRFLGEQSDERREAALRAGRHAADQATTFDLVLESLGVFPDVRRPHTLWIGTGGGASQMINLSRHLENALKEQRFEEEERPLVPHLTIARIKGPLPARSLDVLREREPSNVGTIRVQSFALMESRPAGRSREHVTLEVFALKSDQSGR